MHTNPNTDPTPANTAMINAFKLALCDFQSLLEHGFATSIGSDDIAQASSHHALGGLKITLPEIQNLIFAADPQWANDHTDLFENFTPTNPSSAAPTKANRQINIGLICTSDEDYQLNVVTNGAVTAMFRKSEMPCLEALDDWMSRKDGEGQALGIDFEYTYYDLSPMVLQSCPDGDTSTLDSDFLATLDFANPPVLELENLGDLLEILFQNPKHLERYACDLDRVHAVLGSDRNFPY